MALGDLQDQAKDEDDEVETPWEYDGAALMMYRAGVSTRQGGGVSWSYILRNPSLTLLIRKSPLGGIIAQARLGSECLWRLTPLAALNELDHLVRRLWQMGKLGRIRRTQPATASAARWQVSQVHLAHDVAHAPLAVEQVDRYVSRSRKQSVYEAARRDLTTLYTGLDDPLNAVFADDIDAQFMDGLDWEELYGDEDVFGLDDPFAADELGWSSNLVGRRAVEEPEPVEERASSVHRWGRRVSGITWSPGAAVSFVTYDKVLEGCLRGKSHMPPVWKANGWDGIAPVTRHEARLRRDALRALTLSTTVHTHETSGASETEKREVPAMTLQVSLDDPWVMLEHQQDIFAHVVGRPTATDTAQECPTTVDVAWLRRVVPDPKETNRSRWLTDPVWTVAQSPQFTDVPAKVRRLNRREVRSQQIAKRDRGAYGLVVSRTALAFADPKHWELSHAMQTLYRVFEEEAQKPGKVFHELVRHRRRELGLPVPPESRVLPFRSQPSPVLPAMRLMMRTVQTRMRTVQTRMRTKSETKRAYTTPTMLNGSRCCGQSADSTS